MPPARRSAAFRPVKVIVFLLFSLVGIAGSYGVAWFGIRVNTFRELPHRVREPDRKTIPEPCDSPEGRP